MTFARRSRKAPAFSARFTPESIGLFAPDGGVIDALNYGTQTPDLSMGRFPDATPVFYFMPQPTPRAANANPGLNTAPTIPVIATRYATQGRLLSFFVEASNPEAPPQTLAFTLEPGFPTGAVISLTSGQFTWTPSALQTPGTNAITVRVTDNGSPVKFATRSFTAVAMLDPRIASVQYTPGTGVTISWATVPGLRYRIDYSATLSPIVWLPLTAEFTAPSTTASIDDTPPAGSERYYRVILLN